MSNASDTGPKMALWAGSSPSLSFVKQVMEGQVNESCLSDRAAECHLQGLLLDRKQALRSQCRGDRTEGVASGWGQWHAPDLAVLRAIAAETPNGHDALVEVDVML